MLPFVESLGAIYPILCQTEGTAPYSTGGVPTAYLIAPDGTIAWQGHPGGLQDGDLEEHLRAVDKVNRVSTWAFQIAKQLPEVPAKLSGVPKLLEKLKFGAALKKVESALPRMEGEDLVAGEQIRDWIAGAGTRELERAAGLIRDGQIYKAFLAYEGVEDRFKGHDLAKQAKAAAKALKADKAHALEIKASEKLEAIKAEMRDERDAEDKLKCLKPLLARKYEETLAGREAARLAEELEAKIPAN